MKNNDAAIFQNYDKFTSSKLKLLKPSQYELSDSKSSPLRKENYGNKEYFPLDDAFFDIDSNIPSDECISINSVPTFQSTFNFSEKKGKKRNPNDHIILRESCSVVQLRSERLKFVNKLANQPSFIRESKASTDISPLSKNQFLFQKNKRNFNKCGTSNLKEENYIENKGESKLKSLQRNLSLKINIPPGIYQSNKSIAIDEFSGNNRINKSFGISKPEDSFSKCQYLQALRHEEIKEEVELSSCKHEDKCNELNSVKQNVINHRNTQLINNINPFINFENNSGSK